MVASRWVWGLVGSAVMLSESGTATAQELPPTPILLAQTGQETEADISFNEGRAAFQQETLEGYQQAILFYKNALKGYEQQGNLSRQALTSQQIGRIYYRLGYQQEALDYYQQALPLSRAVGDRSGEATTLNSIGVV
ncbi:MAG: tetratricopeptide repeat protein, partial [Limnothrix sp.]